MDSGADLLMTISNGFTTSIYFMMDLALLIIALTAIRAYRRDLMGWFLFPAILGLVMTVVRPIVTWILFSVADLDYDSVASVHMVISILGAMISGAGYAILLVGIVKLARPVARD